MIEYDYWNTCADKVINKYIRLMKELHVVFSDTYIGYQTCEENKTYDLNKWYVAVTLFNNLRMEIDKFPKRYRGGIYSVLKSLNANTINKIQQLLIIYGENREIIERYY